jgi:hypothetical protein
MQAAKVNIFCGGIFLKIEKVEVGKRGLHKYAGILGKIQYLKGWVVSNIWVDVYQCLQMFEEPEDNSF